MSGPGGGRPGHVRRRSISSIRFSARELRDLVLAWLALGVAFALFFLGGGPGLLGALRTGGVTELVTVVAVSLLTAGVGFLLHEIGHKVAAVRYGQIAEFRADYGMLFLALVSASIGFLFAAPGAVHHQGRITERENGLIALAGPAVNLVLSVLFLIVGAVGIAANLEIVFRIGFRGLAVNLFLAAFNMIPFGALDGATIRQWSTLVWAVVFVPSAIAAFVVVFQLGGL